MENFTNSSSTQIPSPALISPFLPASTLVRRFFSDLSGKMMSLNQTSLGHSPLCQGDCEENSQGSLCCREAGLTRRKDPSLSCCFSRLQNLLMISRHKSITHRKGRGSFLFASLFPFPEKYLPSLQAIVRVWTHMMIALRGVCKYSTDFEGDLCFKSSPFPMAW